MEEITISKDAFDKAVVKVLARVSDHFADENPSMVVVTHLLGVMIGVEIARELFGGVGKE